MVNILDYWPERGDIPKNTKEAWHAMLNQRDAVMSGFLELEVDKGTCPEVRSLSMPDGQDYIRSVCFRILEELSEAQDSVQSDHFLEELIDAFNYLCVLGMFDETLFSYDELAEIFLTNSLVVFTKGHFRYDHKISLTDIGATTIQLGLWADNLRNRSWMNNSQSIQFVGKENTRRLLAKVSQTIFNYFGGWGEFWQYYTAKNKVLEFRLESKY